MHGGQVNPSGTARTTVWLLSICFGAFGWWLASGILTNLFDWPRASYGEAIGLQFSLQVVFHSFALALGALIGEKN
jgi:hypothetical protein